jgi:hypothetical protein
MRELRAEQSLSPPETLDQARPLVMLPARIALLFDSNDHNRRLPLDSPDQRRLRRYLVGGLALICLGAAAIGSMIADSGARWQDFNYG